MSVKICMNISAESALRQGQEGWKLADAVPIVCKQGSRSLARWPSCPNNVSMWTPMRSLVGLGETNPGLGLN